MFPASWARPVSPSLASSSGSFWQTRLTLLAYGVSSHHCLSFPGVLDAEGLMVEWDFLFCF